ncbi:hypothetical protein Leryth_004504 [Lithospermum erythrorhizon]|nr:hypothetical protein Leryth_004504 [Lithospermum erythrorhizon]
MHGPSRLGGTTTSSSLSPPSSPRLRHGRSKSSPGSGIVGGGGGGVNFRGSGEMLKLQNLVERLGYMVMSAVYRRRGVLLFAPLLYISGMLLYMGTLGIDVRGNGSDEPAVPGSVYRSPQVFEKLWPFMEADTNGTSNLIMNVWKPKPHTVWKPCLDQTFSQAGMSELPQSNGFLVVEANGGLNQQRLAICDAVAVAGMLNATLLIPIFHFNSVWRDSSKFRDIFDEEFFIYALKNNVNIVRELPEDTLQGFDNNISNIINLRVKAWSSPTYYLEKVLPKLKELGYIYLLFTFHFVIRVLEVIPL